VTPLFPVQQFHRNVGTIQLEGGTSLEITLTSYGGANYLYLKGKKLKEKNVTWKLTEWWGGSY